MYLDIVKLKRNQKFRKYSAVCKYHYLEIGVTCLQNVNDLIQEMNNIKRLGRFTHTHYHTGDEQHQTLG
jgi:hypothetical protein